MTNRRDDAPCGAPGANDQSFSGSFEADVPAHLQDDTLERICELAHSGDTSSDGISIIDFERHNQCNIEFTGTIEIEGAEHYFHIRDGNNAGTEIIGWNGGAQGGLQREPPVLRALVPARNAVESAIHEGRAAEFLAAWNADLNPTTERGRVLHDLPAKAGYDAFFAPGTGASRTHHAKARSLGYEIGEEYEAIALRKRLHLAELRFCPVDEGQIDSSTAGDILGRWSDLDRMETALGSAVAEIKGRVADRLARSKSTTVLFEEQKELSAYGFRFASPERECGSWSIGLSRAFTLERIDGFDAATLPEDPVKGILASFFRHSGEIRNMDTRVDPVRDASQLLSMALVKMGRSRSTDFPAAFSDALEKLGYRAKNLLLHPEADAGPQP